jgi:hypothetical protein
MRPHPHRREAAITESATGEAVADHVDWHEIAALVHRGCRPRLALNIVL